VLTRACLVACSGLRRCLPGIEHGDIVAGAFELGQQASVFVVQLAGVQGDDLDLVGVGADGGAQVTDFAGVLAA
jgi:hypothetical protein